MTIRRLEAEDADRLRALWAEGLRLLPEHFLLTEAELMAIPEDRFVAGVTSQLWFGAFAGVDMLGYVVARPGSVERLRHTADIGPLYVTKAAQGQGLGHALMHAALDGLTENGQLQAELTVDASNASAIALYKSLGFHIFGRRPRSVLIAGSPRTDLMMIRALDGADLSADA